MDEVIEDFDIVMCCPHLQYHVDEDIKEKNPNKPIYMIPPRMYEVMDIKDVLCDAEDIIEVYKKTGDNPVHFEGEEVLHKITRYQSHRRTCGMDKRALNHRKQHTKSLSKFISLILRHKPEAAGITLDEHGWADVDELIKGINQGGSQRIDRELLEQIVATDEKQRYAFSEDRSLIRANQGHSISVDVELQEASPPEFLYHGTAEKYVASIEQQGLLPQGRLYVHLSGDEETAKKVGQRHGKPVIYKVHSGRMATEGLLFFRSQNGVWLTKYVPVEYLEKVI